jgi:2-oxoglutarate dehydrogenase E2 component (dihydrolipoamide succinyltransferase)
MATKIVVPDLGESVVEATVARWLKKEGDPVKTGEAVVELETDKIALEVSAAQNGVLASIEIPEGQDVQIGDVLGTVETADGEAEPATENGKAEPEPAEMEEDRAPSASTAQDGERATPVARRVAEDRGVDLATVAGSGPGGRVTRQDVESHVQGDQAREAGKAEAKEEKEEPAVPEPRPASKPAEGGRNQERVRMSRRRRTIARRLVESQRTAAMLTTFNEVDMGAVMDLRKRRRDRFEDRHGVRLGFMSFFVKAAIGALKAFPRLNAEIDGDEMVLNHYYDIGIAVGADEGLVVPVLRDADGMSFARIESTILGFVERVRDGSLSLEDLRGGTFTITNGGVFGSLLSTPILNPPQSGILGLHKIEERPVVVEGEIVVRPMMYVALSYDHRIVDGQEAVQFLVKLKELIEDPEELLLAG